ncbi:AAR002Wp [Eremothecium gossypii ATCC 10895]|uniref:Large ribosomal subunit protein bL32m n=1 Tax=Eremothecium gossypii (strain ATCC 10895 / CBS 109.51 / FGSC 9923 / NRRL Y-1056) TaxID=284811 RepID=Q75ES7_EREGS|nr:mitochondrial 54S ribosomal protein YmL32 [Eremothecium gossypii ATCC 10895]AAS50367.2 AAR002Wp [Eremothecium gossypii ATCC 10895]AEY94653.1 FAAR002Wp [Eremothecium gossypii FDAG1]
MSAQAVWGNVGRALSECTAALFPRLELGSGSVTAPRTLLELLRRAGGSQQAGTAAVGADGLVLAVPKKKVSHQKRRQKLYGPGKKQLQMVHHLGKCPSCGHYKRLNTLCMYCVGEIRHIWKVYTQTKPAEPPQEQDLSELDKRILYPGREETEYMKKLKKKDYLEKRMRTLPVDDKGK